MEEGKIRPPQFYLKLFRRLCHPDYLEDIEGDLMERFENDVEEKGVDVARKNFRSEVFRLLRPALLRKIEGSKRLNYYGMFKMNLKMTLRNIMRRKVFSLFNISGLGLGLACVLGIYMWVSYELSFDKFHQHSENIYQVELLLNGLESSVVTPAPLAASLKEEYPDIVNATKFNLMGDGFLVNANDKNFIQKGAKADQAFFEMFDFEFLEGTASNFTEKNIILTEETSTKFFGYPNAVGEEVILKKETYTVSAVLKDLPKNSSFQFDFILPFSTVVKDEKRAWGAWFCATFIQLHEQANPEELLDKSNGFKTFYNKIDKERWSSVLVPLSQIHFNPKLIPFFKNIGDKKYVWVFSIAGVLIFLLTCMNYVSLSTSRYTLHYTQVGLQKTLGANFTNIVQKYLSESVAYTLLAIGFGGVLIYVFQGYFFFNSSQDIFGLLYEYKVLPVFVGISLCMILLTTVFPVLMFSAVKPISLLNKRMSRGASKLPTRRLLVIVQFCISICMITGTFILNDQLSLIQDKDLGYEKENLLSLQLNEETSKSVGALKNELSQYSGIEEVSRSTFESIYFDIKVTEWDAKNNQDDMVVRPMTADNAFAKTFGIEVATGRFFDGRSSDDKTVVINQKAADAMGLADAIGKKVTLPWSREKVEIIGVVDNFNYWGLTNLIEPIFILNGSSGNLFIRLKEDQQENTLTFIKNTFRKLNPNYPLEYTFMSERYNQQHIYHHRTGKIFSYFGVISVIISCLSLLAMMIFTTEQRTKEIGIRKVHGATVKNIVQVLTKDFLLLVAFAFILAVPLIWYTMAQWLEIFAYRVDISLNHVLIGGVLAMVAAFFTIIFQVMKAALTNPIESLRSE